MEQIVTKIEKKYDFGFILTKDELKKIEKRIIDNFKAVKVEELKWNIYFRLQNGVTLVTDSIDKVLELNNEDDEKISELVISVENKTDNQTIDYRVDIDFDANPVQDSGKLLTTYPVNLVVIGKSKDFVRLTWLDIEGRLKNIKRTAFSGRLVFQFFIDWSWLFITIGFVWYFLQLASSNDTQNINDAQRLIAKLDELDKDNSSIASIQEFKKFYIECEKQKQRILNRLDIINTNIDTEISEKIKKQQIRKWTIGGFLVLLLVFGIIYLNNRPLYNFCWGKYAAEFEAIERKRKTYKTLFLGTIVLGILINLISSLIQYSWF